MYFPFISFHISYSLCLSHILQHNFSQLLSPKTLSTNPENCFLSCYLYLTFCSKDMYSKNCTLNQNYRLIWPIMSIFIHHKVSDKDQDALFILNSFLRNTLLVSCHNYFITLLHSDQCVNLIRNLVIKLHACSPKL